MLFCLTFVLKQSTQLSTRKLPELVFGGAISVWSSQIDSHSSMVLNLFAFPLQPP